MKNTQRHAWFHNIRSVCRLIGYLVVIIVLNLPSTDVASDTLSFGSKTPFDSLIHPSIAQAQGPSQTATGEDWFMAGANPQRTSWIAEEVYPDNYSSYGVVWYRPIGAYIGQHVQLIASRDKIYVSTARGLYALNAATGDTVWRYDTELPLGHSPTVVGDTIYVGGFDHKVHALNADTGQVRWIFDQAQAGFSTNPLVVEGKVFLGNRDGYFYALDAATGELSWQYPAANQPPLGPILYSAAYQDGEIYFAANDNFAYALQASTGQLTWKSAKLPGDGFQAWWPVVYKDYVIFSGAVDYRHQQEVGTQSIRDVIPNGSSYQISDEAMGDFIYGIQRDDLFYPGVATGDLLGATFSAGSAQDPTAKNWPWPNGRTVIDGRRATEYYEDDGNIRFDRPDHKPWRRTTVFLERQTGQEYTFDSDGDNLQEYPPFLSVGTKSGNQYPPILMPDKNGQVNEILYKYNFSKYYGLYGISKANAMGWSPANPRYLQFISESTTAIDEPIALSGSGNVVFSNLCCDRVASWLHLTEGVGGSFWNYNKTLESLNLLFETNPGDLQSYQRSLAPQYDEMWWESSMWTGLPRLYGGFGNQNSIYHNHGLQNPFIPYQEKLFVHRSNAIIALGPNPPEVPPSAQLPSNPTQADHEAYEAAIINLKKRPLLTYNKQKNDNIAPITTTDLEQKLETEILKMINQGHLRPGYYGVGQYGYRNLLTYFENPGDTLLTLSIAYPHLSPGTQTLLRTYLQEEYEHYFKNVMYGRIGWSEQPVDPDFGQLAGRESMPLPPEVAEDIKRRQKSTSAGSGWPWNYPQHNFYALWKYAEIFPDEALPIYNKILSENRLQLISQSNGEKSLPDNERLAFNPWEHNAYIAAYIGFLNLQELAGRDTADAALRNQVDAELQRLLDLRASTFEKDQPWVGDNIRSGGDIHRRDMSIARNFLFITPELGTYLHDHALSEAQDAVDEYNWVAPYWFVARYEASVSEGVQRLLYDYPALFQAKAYILGEPQDELVKYLDVSAFEVGDLFYIQNLVAALEAPSVQATIIATPTYGDAPLVVNFDASDSSGELVSYAWDFDDGETGTGQTVSHTYQNDGIYRPTLTVTDDEAKVSTARALVIVGGLQCYLPVFVK
ncbi:MAG: PQQ-binding-like beta-propeller repeat protein [Anaerolineae bacterium]|nr:PQQ-binding-like beta-propeller repeat protein [Anaerolineae bacterium]